MTCAVGECERPVSARGWCRMHYARWLRTGSPTGRFNGRPAPARPFPLGPLEQIARSSRHAIQRTTNMGGEQWAKVLAEGFTVFQADRAACAYGLLPYEVWGPLWWETDDVVLSDEELAS